MSTQRFRLVVPSSGPYTLSLESVDFDALLRLEEETGEAVAEDDDSGVETEAWLVVELQDDRTYVVVVAAKTDVGDFTLSVHAGVRAAPTGAELLDAAIDWHRMATERRRVQGDLARAVRHRVAQGERLQARARFAEARAAYEEALGWAREVGDRAWEGRTLLALGLLHHPLGEYEQARERHLESLAIGRELGDRIMEMSAVMNLGLVHQYLGDHPAALECFKQYLAFAEEVGEPQYLGAVYANLGVHHQETGEYAQAAEYMERQLALSRRIGNQDWELIALQNLGALCESTGNLPRAREYMEQTLDLSRRRGDSVVEAAALVNLGVLHVSLGHLEFAESLLEQGRDLASRIGHLQWEANATNSLGLVQGLLGKLEAALENLERYQELTIATGDRSGQARALGNLGFLLRRMGEPRRALEYSLEQLRIARALGIRAVGLDALGHVGTSLWQLGELLGARERFEEQLSLARDLESMPHVLMGLGNLGALYQELGDHVRARELLLESLALSRDLGYAGSEARVQGNLALVLTSLGEYSEAERCLLESLKIGTETGERFVIAKSLGNLGAVYLLRQDFDRAQEHLERSLELAQQLGERAAEQDSLLSLSQIAVARGDQVLATDLLMRCLELARAAGDRRVQAMVHGNLGHLRLDSGELADALTDFTLNLELATEVGDRPSQARALGNLARLQRLLGVREEAHRRWTEAERLLEGLGSGGLEHGEGVGLRGRFDFLAAAAQDICALWLQQAGGDQDERDRALAWGFAASGRWKGRGLLQGMAEHRSGARPREASELRRRWRELHAEYGAQMTLVSTAIRRGTGHDEVEALRTAAGSKLEEAQTLAATLQARFPRDAALDLPPTVDPRQAREALLGAGDVLVEFSLGESRLYAYVLDSEHLEFLDLGDRLVIEAEVEEFVTRLGDPMRPSGPPEIARLGRTLFERLLAPAIGALPEAPARLVIVPDGALATLPFEALVAEADPEPTTFGGLVFVIDRYYVTYGPSVPILVQLAGTPARAEAGKVLVLADPCYGPEGDLAVESTPASTAARGEGVSARIDALGRLPATRDEALAIARVLEAGGQVELETIHSLRSGSWIGERVEIHLGEKATRRVLDGDLRPYVALHLACHGRVDADEPRRTGIALSPTEGEDGFFTLADAMGLDLDADLIVLSACRTAQGEVRAGEGVESLARAFLFAGARGLVGSLWQVDDRATADTMQHFYSHWLLEGLPPDRALRQAKLGMRAVEIRDGAARGIGLARERSREDDGLGHPFLWAPFIHIGLAR